VAWVYDQHGRPALDLSIDGHPAHIRSSQKSELLRRGIVDGVVFLASERREQVPNIYMHGDFGPEFQGLAMVGCTDDPEVFALYLEMCEAIRTDHWRAGARPLPN
jgi:hypothetical protein